MAGATTAILSCASLCVDVKPGSPKASDQVQVMLYMYLLPLACPEYQGLTITGQAGYGDHGGHTGRCGGRRVVRRLGNWYNG